MARFIYLHGFASSPSSTKAVFFRERLEQLGHTVLVPALDEGDFEGLTISRQLAVVRRALDTFSGPCALIGSSMGGYLAALAAMTEPRVERLVLMAPAMDMRARWAVRFGADRLAFWKAKGAVPTYHHAHREERLIGYGLYEDMAGHDSNPAVHVPTLAFMGRSDQVVEPEAVEQWATRQASVKLRWLDSGHELVDQLETLWTESVAFLSLAVPEPGQQRAGSSRAARTDDLEDPAG
jgi:pimeloyl-ACP methyl ester carboxylesterase